MAEKTKPAKRRFSYRYFKPYKKEFRLYKLVKDYFTYVVQLNANIPRSYSKDIGKDFYEMARSVLFMTKQANNFDLGSRERFLRQIGIVEKLDDLQELFDPLERLKLITPSQNGELSKKTDELRFQFELWFDSDLRQIRENGIKDRAADIRVQKSCWE